MANQGWRILKHPNSLASRVLKGCYFSDCDFLEASKGSSTSFIWNSIIWGKEVLDKGLRWRVGDGSSILVFKDKWIPNPSTFKVISPQLMSGNTTVSQLMYPSGGWDLNVINQNFCKDDRTAILSIPTSSSCSNDCLIWHYDDSGVFNVKSGYRLACNSS